MTTLVVLGAGVSGRAAADLGVRLGHDVTLYDLNPDVISDVALDVATASGPWDSAVLAGADLIVTSPGIPLHAAPIVDAIAHPAPLVSEVEFGVQHLTSPYVAITGTNGKTTVTETTAAMLQADGLNACAAGNVGLAVSDIALKQWDCVAIEVSSFQLHFIDTFRPVAAAILNIAPDHIDWHGGFSGYAADKARIGMNQTAEDVFVFDPHDAVTSDLRSTIDAKQIPVSGTYRPEGGNGPDDAKLRIGQSEFPMPDLDPVWMFDVAVAATLSQSVGVSDEAIATVLSDFAPGAHRRTLVAVESDVAWVNDSKATNPHAAIASASSYPAVILIAGGRNKDLDLSGLVAVDSVRHVFAIGEAAVELKAAGGDRVTVVDRLAQAIEKAAAIARSGDTVLLAPGCASFDMFTGYDHRGDEFTRLVRNRLEVDHGIA